VSEAGTPDARGRVAIKRVQRASDQVAIQLRDMIVSGVLPDGARLPTEIELARQSGVSRATIREALHMLASEGLTISRRGVNGGTFVTLPSPDDVMDTLRFGVTLLSNTNGLTIENLLETRELLEVPAAGLAAQRRTDEDLERLLAAIPAVPEREPMGQGLHKGTSFHVLLLQAAHNPLLAIASQPVHHVLTTRLTPQALIPELVTEINRQHADIAAAIERQDADEARRRMQEHLDFLRPRHEGFWHQHPASG
jgi:DNA-binding FadR family transcriptional regulator